LAPATETFPEIPLFDLRLEPEDFEAVAEALRGGWLTMGPRTAEFETAFAEQLGSRHAVAVSSCTAALHLAYLGAGVGPGDEVIVPSMTFVATAAAVVYCGATPVFADILGPHDLSIDPADVEARISERTKAVAVVHFAGYPAPVEELSALCDRHGLALIEDSAHAPSASRAGKKLGTFGLAGAFSFFSNKILSIGEGGLLATDNDEVADQARLLRSHAMTSGTWDRHRRRSDTYDVVGLGFNYRIDEPRAALLLSRLSRMEADIDRRRELVRRYRRRLSSIGGISVPYRDEDVADSSCYVMPIMVVDPDRQDVLRDFLREERGIQTSLFYPPAHRFTAYRERWGEISLPRTEDAADREITIPLYPHLSDDELDHVVTAIDEGLRR
jgi:dTDP-4-amino-4,6-dideoxygalactose transaminase